MVKHRCANSLIANLTDNQGLAFNQDNTVHFLCSFNKHTTQSLLLRHWNPFTSFLALPVAPSASVPVPLPIRISVLVPVSVAFSIPTSVSVSVPVSFSVSISFTPIWWARSASRWAVSPFRTSAPPPRRPRLVIMATRGSFSVMHTWRSSAKWT